MPLGVEELRTQAVVPDAVARHDGGNVDLPVEPEFVIAGLEPARERRESAMHGGDAEVTSVESDRRARAIDAPHPLAEDVPGGSGHR